MSANPGTVGVATPDPPDADALLADGRLALDAAHRLLGALRAGATDTSLPAPQFREHGFAWAAAYLATLEATLGWASALAAADRLGLLERRIASAGFAEYLAQLGHGIAMSQDEIVRPGHLGASAAAAAFLADGAVARFVDTCSLRAQSHAIVAAVDADGGFGDAGLDETHAEIEKQFRRFADEVVAPAAPGWHANNALIPDAVVAQMSELGVFGLTVPEAWGGLGLGKVAMCVVTEALSRGYIGVGSLGTRSEIACELILHGGTDAQRAHWLPKIASGEVLPTAVFTEPNTGSDLASLSTRGSRRIGADGREVFSITGSKTWITHAARSDLMTLLVRTLPDEPRHRGISMLLAPKPRGSDADPFPAAGMRGGEIAVLGYRGMREYEIGFDGFEVDADAVLGGVEGQGFRQLMQTFESARIQTAARALGVAQNALELGLAYARERRQFGRAIVGFDRIAGKIAQGVVETMMIRQLVLAAARRKDEGRRCDVEAGMAKLLAARLAWSVADNALQIHGGNGYALEYPISRVLCDARILNIFEGAAEIQAGIVAKGLIGS
ncbi:MAG: acyl-CoA dehydrogenase family protein [Lautropia sp.]